MAITACVVGAHGLSACGHDDEIRRHAEELHSADCDDGCSAEDGCIVLSDSWPVCASARACDYSNAYPDAYVCRDARRVAVAPSLDAVTCTRGSEHGLVACSPGHAAHVVSREPSCSVYEEGPAGTCDPSEGCTRCPADCGLC